MKFYVVFALICGWCFPSQLQAQDSSDLPEEEVSESDTAALLQLSQEELVKQSQGGLGLGLGNTNPWQYYSLSAFWPYTTDIHWQVSLGGGGFEFSSKSQGKTVTIETDSRTVLFGGRHYFTSLAPIFYEPVVGLSFWSGDIRPTGSDSVTDTSASSLVSDFDATGLTVGIKTGFQWWFQNQVFLEFAILQLSYSVLIGETYTNNTPDVRDSVREQLRGPNSWSGINVKVGYTFF